MNYGLFIHFCTNPAFHVMLLLHEPLIAPLGTNAAFWMNLILNLPFLTASKGGNLLCYAIKLNFSAAHSGLFFIVIFLWHYFLCVLDFCHSGQFDTQPSLSSWPLLPCWHWATSPLPRRLSFHLPRTERGWGMLPLSPRSLLWQACISGPLRCSPLSCRVNTSPLLLFDGQFQHCR